MANKDIVAAGKKTQFPHNNPRLGGRKKSIKNELRAYMDKKGKLTIDKSNVLSVNPDGSVEIKIPEREALVMKLLHIAKGRTSNNIKAIQMIMEHLEGKPTQLFEFAEYQNVPTIFVDATEHMNDEEE